MSFLAKRARAALTAFMQSGTAATKSYGNSWGDLLYGSASGLMGHNRDLTFTEQGIATAFGLNTGLQRGIRFKQDALGMLKWGIYDSNTNELLISMSDRTLDMSQPGAVLLTAFRNYSLRHYHDFIGNLIFSNNMYGESFVYRLSNPLGGVTGVRWLNPLFTEPDIQRGKIEQFRYSAGEGSFLLPASDMAFNIYHPNPHDDLRGMPPALSALDSMNIERNEKRAVGAYFANGMNPGLAMSPKSGDHLTEMEIRQMETRFKQMYGGVDNMFRALITPTEFLYHNFEQPDLQKNWSIIKEARTEVTMALGVPVELAGDPSNTKYENADKVMQNWLRVNGKAEANGIGGFVTDHLLRYTDPNAAIYFGYDTSDIDRQDAPLTQSDFTSGIIPINIAQAERGYEVDPLLDNVYIIGGKPMHRDTIVKESRGIQDITGKFQYNQAGIAIPQSEVFGYHIESGKVSDDEVRAKLGLPPAVKENVDPLQVLQGKLSVMQTAVAAGIPVPIAAQMVGVVLPPGAVPMAQPGATIPGQLMPGQPVEQPEPQKGAASLWVGLSLANNPDLIDLQKRLKSLYPDPAIKWNDPADFHITLLYCPAVEDAQVEELTPSLDLSPDGLALSVGSLACFDNVGEHALHFRVARNSALLDMQSSLYDTAESIGLQTSGHSRPDGYTPHITMGYLPEKIGRIVFHGKVKVTPVDVICSVERGGEQETVWSSKQPVEDEPGDIDRDILRKQIHLKGMALNMLSDFGKRTVNQLVDAGEVEVVDGRAVPAQPETEIIALTHDDHTHELPVITRDYSPAAALAELKAWRMFMSKKRARPFEFVMLRGDPADEIAERLKAGDSPDAIIEALKPRFDGSRLKALSGHFAQVLDLALSEDVESAVKSLGSIESDFTSRFAPVIESMRDGQLSSRQRAGNILRQLIRMFGAAAYREGLKDGGVEDDPDEREQAEISSLISEQSGYVSNLTERVLSKDGENDTLAAGQASVWFRKSIQPFYYAGYASAKSNQMMEFTGDDGLESCSTCKHLKFQRHRLGEWKAKKLIPQVDTDSYECGGWRCNHNLTETTGKARGKW